MPVGPASTLWAVALLAAASLFAACSSGSSSSTPTTTEEPAVATTAGPAVTSRAPTTLTSGKATTAEGAAQGFFAAGRAGDRAAAARLGTPKAVTQLFSRPLPAEASFEGCQEMEAGAVDCTYSHKAGTISLFTSGSRTAGYTVQSVDFVARPSGP